MKKYIKPSIIVEKALLTTVMAGLSKVDVTGSTSGVTKDKIIVSGKSSWDNDDESEDAEY